MPVSRGLPITSHKLTGTDMTLKRRSYLSALVFVVLFGIEGCGGMTTSQSPKNSVSGTVRFDGKIVNYGSVSFYDANGRPKKVMIQTDGTYTFSNSVPGQFKITVNTGSPPPPMASPDGPAGKAPDIVKIDLPAEYSDIEKTPLHYEVTPGQNKLDIDIQSKSDGKKP
jgi:hypothetical protein